MTRQICDKCFKEFSSTKSLEFHKSICIYYQYRSKYLSNVSDNNIKDIIIIFNSINISNNDAILSKNKILTNIKLKYTIKTDNILLYLYNKILKTNLEFYNYSDVINLISAITNIQFNDVIDVINTFNKCTKNII